MCSTQNVILDILRAIKADNKLEKYRVNRVIYLAYVIPMFLMLKYLKKTPLNTTLIPLSKIL
jgi:hypothetical protein